MGSLQSDSKLWAALHEKYLSNKNDDITEAFFEECIDIACKYSKRQIRYLMFKLHWLTDDMDTGIEPVNQCVNMGRKFMDVIFCKDVERRFVFAVLEAALEELT